MTAGKTFLGAGDLDGDGNLDVLLRDSQGQVWEKLLD